MSLPPQGSVQRQQTDMPTFRSFPERGLLADFKSCCPSQVSNLALVQEEIAVLPQIREAGR